MPKSLRIYRTKVFLIQLIVINDMNDKPLEELVESIITSVKSQHSQIQNEVKNNENGAEDKTDVVSIQSASTGEWDITCMIWSFVITECKLSHYKDTSNTYYYRPPTPASTVYTESVESNPKTGLIGELRFSENFVKQLNSARVSSLFLLGTPVTYKSATSIANATSLTSIREDNEEQKSGIFKVLSRVSSLILGSKNKSNVDLREFTAKGWLKSIPFQLKQEMAIRYKNP